MHEAGTCALARYGAVTVVTLVGMALGASTLDGSWRFDDPLVLQFVQGLTHWHLAFFDATAWRSLGVPFFTPLIALVFRIADGVFGLWSPGHYLLQGLALVTIALLSYRLVAFQGGPAAGAVTGVLFLLGTPTLVVAQQLMTAHYAWGMVLALLACLAWQRFLRGGSWHWTLVSAILYLLAMLGKEIYAPLPMALLALAWRSPQRSGAAALAGLAGHAAVAVLYVFWRAAMIGAVVGGYGLQVSWQNLWASGAVLSNVFWGGGAIMTWLGSLLALGLVVKGLWWQGLRAMVVALALVVGIALPYCFVIVSPDVEHYRFGLLPWWGLCLGVGTGLGRTGRCVIDSSGWVAALVLALVLVPAWKATRTQLQQITRVYDDMARHVLRPGPARWVVPGGLVASDLHFQYGLARIARRQDWAPTWMEPFVQYGAAAHGADDGSVYDVDCRCMHAAPAAPVQPLPPDGRIQATIRNLSGARAGLAWAFSAPRVDGVWYLHWPGLGVSMRVPAQGASYFAPPVWIQGQAFHIIWQSPDGSWTQTPLQRFPAPGGGAAFGVATPG